MNVRDLIVNDGYLALGVLVGAESLGVPLPGETALIAAGTYAGFHHHLALPAIVGVAFGAAVVGDAIGYLIGHLIGWPLLIRFGHRIGLSEARLKVIFYLFNQRGVYVVGAGRFISILRTYVALVAGVVGMRFPRFVVASGAGALIWSILYGVGSYELGSVIHRVSTWVAIALGVLVVVGLLLAGRIIRRRFEQLSRVAQETFPGSLSAHRKDART